MQSGTYDELVHHLLMVHALITESSDDDVSPPRDHQWQPGRASVGPQLAHLLATETLQHGSVVVDHPFNDEDICVVCQHALCPLGGGEPQVVRRLRKCGHLYHTDCLEQWLMTGSDRCPVCRAALAAGWYQAAYMLPRNSSRHLPP